MLHPSTKRLIDKLGEKTALQALAWTEGEGDALVLDTEGYRVTLTDAPIEVVLSDPLGKELERATHEDLTGAHTEDGQTYSDFVIAMRSEAQRIARGAEYAIERVLAGLENTEKDDVVPAAAVAPAEAVEIEPDDMPTQTDETTLIVESVDEQAPDVEMAVHKLAEEVNSPIAPAPEVIAPVEVEQSTGHEIPLTSIGSIAGFSGTVQLDETPAEDAADNEELPQSDVLPVIEDTVRGWVQAVSKDDKESGEDAIALKLLSQVAEEASNGETPTNPVSVEVIDEANSVLMDPFAATAPHDDVSDTTAGDLDADATSDDTGKVTTSTRFNPWN